MKNTSNHPTFQGMIVFFYLTSLVIASAVEMTHLEEIKEQYLSKDQKPGGSIKEATSLRPIGAHTATSSREAFTSGLMEVGLPFIKDTFTARRYFEYLFQYHDKKSPLARFKQMDEAEAAFNLKNQTRRAAYNLQNHTLSFLGKYDEKKPIDEPKNESAFKHLYSAERSHEALVQGIEKLHDKKDFFDARYNSKKKTHKIQLHNEEMVSFIELAKNRPHEQVLADVSIQEAYQNWKASKALRRDKTLDRARLNGTHVAEATNLAVDTVIGTSITAATGGAFGVPFAVGLGLNATSRLTNAGLREIETRKIRKIRHSDDGEDEKEKKIKEIKKTVSRVKTGKTIAFGLTGLGLAGSRLPDVGVSLLTERSGSLDGLESTQAELGKAAAVRGLYKNGESTWDNGKVVTKAVRVGLRKLKKSKEPSILPEPAQEVLAKETKLPEALTKATPLEASQETLVSPQTPSKLSVSQNTLKKAASLKTPRSPRIKAVRLAPEKRLRISRMPDRGTVRSIKNKQDLSSDQAEPEILSGSISREHSGELLSKTKMKPYSPRLRTQKTKVQQK